MIHWVDTTHSPVVDRAKLTPVHARSVSICSNKFGPMLSDLSHLLSGGPAFPRVCANVAMTNTTHGKPHDRGGRVEWNDTMKTSRKKSRAWYRVGRPCMRCCNVHHHKNLLTDSAQFGFASGLTHFSQTRAVWSAIVVL